MTKLSYVKLGFGVFFMLLGAYVSLGLQKNFAEVIFGIISIAIGVSIIASSQK